MSGELVLAADDLQAFLLWVDGQPRTSPYRREQAQVKEWLGVLKDGVNPISPEVLESLRRE